MTHDDLIARLESAPEGSRELDKAIWLHITDAPYVDFRADTADWLPHYTTSLDAALELVPEGWTAWELRSHGRKTRFSADLSRMSECDAGEDWAHGMGSTPALALVIAVLRARQP